MNNNRSISRGSRQPVSHQAQPEGIVDVRQQEQNLRKECATLASELAFVLQAAGRPIEIRQIHAEAKRRFSKAQNELSIVELQRKRDWLQKCLSAERLV